MLMEAMVVAGFTPVKVAVTEAFALSAITQEAPVQPPLKPSKVDDVGVAVRVTLVPELKLALHVPGQLMPAGDEVTVPVPVPASATVNVRCRTPKVAVALAAALTVTWQVLVPEQAPLQPLKTELVPGVAVSVTAVPWLYEAEQVPDEQLMPPGVEVTAPWPAPATCTLRAYCGMVVKVAVAEAAALSVT